MNSYKITSFLEASIWLASHLGLTPARTHSPARTHTPTCQWWHYSLWYVPIVKSFLFYLFNLTVYAFTSTLAHLYAHTHARTHSCTHSRSSDLSYTSLTFVAHSLMRVQRLMSFSGIVKSMPPHKLHLSPHLPYTCTTTMTRLSFCWRLTCSRGQPSLQLLPLALC